MEFRPLGKTSESIPEVGMGTWGMGGGMRADSSRDSESIEALTLGLELGMTLVDTAEMYGAGHSEEVVSKALEGWREPVFVASKVSPSHFAYDDLLHSARKSVDRLRVKQMDLYQLHWPNPRTPIAETMKGMEKLVLDGMVRYIGVSNFSVAQMRDAQAALSREEIVSNQVEYSLVDRTVEEEILPYCQREKLTLIAYSPLGQGRIARGRGGPFKIVDEIAARLGKSRSQVALNWLLQHESVVVIPKAGDKKHVVENAAVSGSKLSTRDFQEINKAFR
ncbi:MAG TPA: aldo/keto reductase [Candidatus Limnocylindrales bacterium]|nr:aldo/keto reductase [Candidatus Limnocylindrales bacterium]